MLVSLLAVTLFLHARQAGAQYAQPVNQTPYRSSTQVTAPAPVAAFPGIQPLAAAPPTLVPPPPAHSIPFSKPAPAKSNATPVQQSQPTIYRVAAQEKQPAAPAMNPRYSEDRNDYPLSEVPQIERLFRRESEKALFERMRQEAKRRDESIRFPEEPILARELYRGRHFPPMQEIVPPYYVCYGRLLFEQKNFERYGWDLGPITPLISGAKFYMDVAALPYNWASSPHRRWECSAGYCLPGDPVPLLLYNPEISLTGLTAEAAVVAGLFLIFP